jgi:hypothetical protein
MTPLTKPQREELLKPEVWFDGDYSECWYGTGPLTKERFVELVNADEMMESEEPCRVDDVVDTLAKDYGEGRFYLLGHRRFSEQETDPYPILVWRPM